MTIKITDFVKDGFTLEQEIFAWSLMCGKKFEDFIKIPPAKRTVEDYGKYLGISIVFHFKRMFLRLINDCEDRLEEILNYISTEGKKLEVVDEWINEAINHIPDEELQNICLDYWNNAKSKFNAQTFDITKLFTDKGITMEKKHYIDMEFVKQLMEEKSIDIQTLAKAVKLSPKTLKKYLDGADQSNITADLLFHLSKALDVPMHILLHKDYYISHKKH